MLTIFTVPKAFRQQTKIIQANAIRSWLRLRPACEVILLGNEEGVAEIAEELGTRHIPDVKCNKYGTPLVHSMFNLAQELGSQRLMCYANADIILLSDFLQAVALVRRDSFLIVGRRWDLDLDYPLDFSDPDWEAKVLACVRSKGKLHTPKGLDYFVFPRGLWRNMPPFAIGRPGWDNWMVFRARSLRIPVIDATKVITAIHQNHDYSHLVKGEETMRRGAEARRNLELLGGMYHSFNVQDATLILTTGGSKPAASTKHLLRRILRLPELHPHFIPLVQLILTWRIMRNLVVSIRSKIRAS